MRALVLAAVALVVAAVPAEARHRGHYRHHHHPHLVGHHHAARVVVANNKTGGVVRVDSAAGPIVVAASVAEKMTGFIADVVDRGFRGRVHCFAPSGHIRHSLHHWGGACDFAQRGWDKTVEPMYDVADLAGKWGLKDGCTFRRRRDCGHIQAPR